MKALLSMMIAMSGGIEVEPFPQPKQGRDIKKWHDPERVKAAQVKRLRKQAKRLRNEK